MLVAGDLAEAPGAGERDDDRRDHGRTDHAEAEDTRPAIGPRNGVKASADLADRVEFQLDDCRIAGLADGGGGGDQHGRHDQLRDHRAERVSQRAPVIVLGPKLLIGDRRLLIEDHPRHDDGADIGGDKIEIIRIAERQCRQPLRPARAVRMGRTGDPEEREFEQAESDGTSSTRR